MATSTTNYSFNIAEGTDTVNLLTQCYPNFTSLDSILKEIDDSDITVASETKSGTVHQLVRSKANRNVIRFTATSNFTLGDTFTVDGSPVTAVTVAGTALQTGDFVINSNVIAILNGALLTVYAGGSVPSPTAADVSYDNTGSGLTATDVQDAIDEVLGDIPANAAALSYDNTGSGLTAANVQDAIDEIVSGIGGGSVETTSDGIKTTAQVLNTLFALIDMSKVTSKSTLYYYTAAQPTVKNVMHVNKLEPSAVEFSSCYINSNGFIDTIRVASSSTKKYITTNSATSTDVSNIVEAAGWKFGVEY